VRTAQIALAGLQEEALTGTRTVLDDMERHYKEVKDKWIGFAGGLKG
jgi:hypothetical protein